MVQRTPQVIVIGAGVGGLAAAIRLAARGCGVTVLEASDAPGGKMREVLVDGRGLDAGPTVLTMRAVFDDLFAQAGATLADHVTLKPAALLARHAWGEARLDLFADMRRSMDAIGAFAGAAEAEGFRRFQRRAADMFRTLEGPFIHGSAPSPLELVQRAGVFGLGDLARISPFATLWASLGDYFRDPRMRQLFGRYATYCGSSPYQASATLMLVAHVEQAGVWLVEGGMHRLAQALAALAQAQGVTLRYGARAACITVAHGRAAGVTLADGEQLAADAIVWNGEVSALGNGLLGEGVAQAAPATPRRERSLSAVTWAMRAQTTGFPLSHHNVFFSSDYKAEFEAIFKHSALPAEPTVYICAQDRGADDDSGARGPERLLCLVNAPASGDQTDFEPEELEQCEAAMTRVLARCGLTIEPNPHTIRTTPAAWERLFPATGGALYGRASHGWAASFARPGARSRLPGLYLAGGSVHPGPGAPMAALSGRQAALAVMADLALTRRSVRGAMSGGMSTR